MLFNLQKGENVFYFSVGDNQSFRILNRDKMISNPELFFLLENSSRLN